MMAPRYSNQKGFEIATKPSLGITNRKQLEHDTLVTTKALGYELTASSVRSTTRIPGYELHRLQSTLSAVLLLISPSHQQEQ